MRKKLLFGLVVACCALVMALQADGKENYPTKNIELVCPYGAGGSTSMGARIIAGTLSEMIGRTVVVNNKPGAGGSIGAEYVAKAKPDG